MGENSAYNGVVTDPAMDRQATAGGGATPHSTTISTISASSVSPGVQINVPAFGAYSGQHSMTHVASVNAQPGAATSTATQTVTSQDVWKAEQKPWSATPGGRLAIRGFSRAGLGCLFFVWGGMKSQRDMEGYDPEGTPRNLLQFIAKTVDVAVGKPIEWTANMLGFDGKRAVTFCSTHAHTVYPNGDASKAFRQKGITLGDQVIQTTWDFFMASVGDAWGRNIAGIFDPAVEKKWLKDGHIVIPQLIKDTLKATWKIITYNGGEDFAVAIPYVYQVRSQHYLLNKWAPGFVYDGHARKNGGSVIINDKGEITGNYQLQGALDLEGRFVGYNIGTLMYREAYRKVGDAINDWLHPTAAPNTKNSVTVTDAGGGSAPEQAGGIFSPVYNTVRYVVKSVIKGAIYMTPAVCTFWVTRTPESKDLGYAIHPEHGPVAYGAGSYVQANDWKMGRYPNGVAPTTLHFSQGQGPSRVTQPYTGPHPFGKNFDPFGSQYNFGVFDSVLNPIGRVVHQAADIVRPVAGYMGEAVGLNRTMMERASLPYTKAVASYFPYMYTKAELANLWDNKQMDISINRALDGAFHLNPGEFKAGFSEVARTIARKPLEEQERRELVERLREEEKRRGRDDNSPREEAPPPHILPSTTTISTVNAAATPRASTVEQILSTRKAQPQVTSYSSTVSPQQTISHAAMVQQQKASQDATVPPGVSIH